MRRPRKSSGASLDSLLDTMTNVVGILVIMLTVTQLGVGDAVQRIATTDTVKPEEIEAARERLRELQLLFAQLRERLQAFDQDDAEDITLKLRKLQREIEDYEADLEVLRENDHKKNIEPLLRLQKLKDEMEKLLEQHKKEAEALLGKLNKTAEEIASLQAKLADAPSLGPVQAKIVNLPNPRAAPKGAEPVQVLCREGRVFFLDEKGIQEKAQKRTLFIIQRRKLGLNPAVGVDSKILGEEFNRDPPRDRNFDLKMTFSGRVPRLTLARKEDAGETVEQLQRTSARYQQQIRRTDPKRYYLQFRVWPDSFEAYIEARKIATKRGVLAGWKLQTSTAEYAIPLGGKLRVGPPPPPPKPRPPGEKPPPKPPKPTRAVPTDVID